MAIRGLRGAITVLQDTKEDILSATKELLQKMLKENKLGIEDIASIIFSTTPDLTSEFPAFAARQMGMDYTPLLCTHEMNVPGSLKKCVRILMHVNTAKTQKEMRAIYLREAASLRPDQK